MYISEALMAFRTLYRSDDYYRRRGLYKQWLPLAAELETWLVEMTDLPLDEIR